MDKITQDKISSISIIRVIAMLSIILGHYLMMKNIYTYQLLSIGVEIFLLVSGYLYGTRGGGYLTQKHSLLGGLEELSFPCGLL